MKTWPLNRSFVRVLFALAGSVFVLLILDQFDFLGRWAGHFEPFKNNAERVFYFVFVVVLIWRLRNWLAIRIKSLKISAGDYGFEVDLGMRSDKNDWQGIEMSKKVSEGIASPGRNTRMRAFQFERFALDRMSKELGVAFSSNPIFRQRNLRFAFDGYAERNGRIYVVEVKASDASHILDRAIDLMTMFVQRLPTDERYRLTFVLCVLSVRSQEDLSASIVARRPSLPFELQVRTFKPNEIWSDRGDARNED